jgi:hypothetical protein
MSDRSEVALGFGGALRSLGSRMKTSTARSGSMWLALMKPTMWRPVSSSTSALSAASIARCRPWRIRNTTSSSPTRTTSRSARVSASSITTKIASCPSVVRARLGPRPLTSASRRTTTFEIAAANWPPTKRSSDTATPGVVFCRRKDRRPNAKLEEAATAGAPHGQAESAASGLVRSAQTSTEAGRLRGPG